MFRDKKPGPAALAVLLLMLGEALAADQDQPPQLSAELAAEVDGELLADFPLLFKLTVTNTGNAPIHYWCGGPEQYPRASPFVATVTDEQGQTRKLRLHNGQYHAGSGHDYTIEKTQTLPAACDPLPAGVYQVSIAAKADFQGYDEKKIEMRPALSANPLTITVVDDRAALALANDRLRDREQADTFARHVAQVYSIDPIVEIWLKQLLDDDPNVGLKATGHLQHVLRLPPGGDAFYKQAATKHCRPGTGRAERNLLRQISLNCRRYESADAIDAIVIIATSAADEEYARKMAVSDLCGTPGEHAERALLDLAAKKDSPVYWQALLALANRRNRVALEPLLGAATDPTSKQRAFALVALTRFRELPEVRAALDSALKDDNPFVREAARKTLEWQDFDPDTMIRWSW